MAEENSEEAALLAEHEALKRRTLTLSREHERLRADGSKGADRASHRERLHENVIALEQHYARLRRRAACRDRERGLSEPTRLH
jgi:hypothetical protein